MISAPASVPHWRQPKRSCGLSSPPQSMEAKLQAIRARNPGFPGGRLRLDCTAPLPAFLVSGQGWDPRPVTLNGGCWELWQTWTVESPHDAPKVRLRGVAGRGGLELFTTRAWLLLLRKRFPFASSSFLDIVNQPETLQAPSELSGPTRQLVPCSLVRSRQSASTPLFIAPA